MFINLSNHPSHLWSKLQIKEALNFGEIKDLQFPTINEEADKKDIIELAIIYLQKIIEMGTPNEITIHIMGEQTFCFYFITIAKEKGYKCIASTSKRIVIEKGNGQKEVTFQFCRFRDY